MARLTLGPDVCWNKWSCERDARQNKSTSGGVSFACIQIQQSMRWNPPHASIKATEEAHEICCCCRCVVAIVPLRSDLWKPFIEVLTPYGLADIDRCSSSVQFLRWVRAQLESRMRTVWTDTCREMRKITYVWEVVRRH